MVCDVDTGTFEPFVTPNGGVCNGDYWYFDNDNMGNNHDEPKKLVGFPAVASYNWLTIGVCAKDN